MTSRTRRCRWVRPSPSAPRSGNGAHGGRPGVRGGVPGRLAAACRPVLLRHVASSSAARAAPVSRRTDRSASTRLGSNTCSKSRRVLSLSSEPCGRHRTAFESNRRSTTESETRRAGGTVMGCRAAGRAGVRRARCRRRGARGWWPVAASSRATHRCCARRIRTPRAAVLVRVGVVPAAGGVPRAPSPARPRSATRRPAGVPVGRRGRSRSAGRPVPHVRPAPGAPRGSG